MGQFWTPITAKGGSLLHAVLQCKSPLLFFTVKYSVTSAAIMIVLSIKNNFIWGTKIHARFFLGIFFFALALVIQWQLFLLYQLTD